VRRIRTGSGIAAGAFALVLAACGASAAGHGDYAVRCLLVDSDSGAEVVPHNVYVVATDDTTGEETNINHLRSAAFVLRMPNPHVRLRITDYSDKYQAYSASLEIPPKGLDHAVVLVATHYVLMKGRVLEQHGTDWVPVRCSEGIGGSPLISFHFGRTSRTLHFRDDASFEIRLPRERVPVDVLDSALALEAPFVDLSGVTADVVERDIHLVP